MTKTNGKKDSSTYVVTKRRAWHAPEGSGVPVGTEYHWCILADQNVRKVDANNYTTSTTGLKYKLAHKCAERKMEHHRKCPKRTTNTRFLYVKMCHYHY